MIRRPLAFLLAVGALGFTGLGATGADPGPQIPPATATELEPCRQDRYQNGEALERAVAEGNDLGSEHSIALRPGCIYALRSTLTIRSRQYNEHRLAMALRGEGAVVERRSKNGDPEGLATSAATNDFRIFDVEPGAHLSIDGLTIRGGQAEGDDGGGGAIRVGAGGRLDLARATLRRNTSTGAGAALAIYGDAEVIDTTISANQSGPNGSIVHNATRLRLAAVTVSGNRGDGGVTVRNTGDAEIVRSTLAENAAQAAVVENTATLRVAASTIADNEGFAVLDRADAVLFSTILAGNTGANCAGDPVRTGRILSTDTTCNGTQGSVTLGSLRHNGGPTRTKALRHNSSGVDPGPCEMGMELGLGLAASDLAYDQRGVARDDSCDIGAFERLDADQDGYDDLTETG